MKWQHKNTLSVLELQAALGLHGVGPAQWPCSAVNTERANTSGPCKGCRWAYTGGLTQVGFPYTGVPPAPHAFTPTARMSWQEGRSCSGSQGKG